MGNTPSGNQAVISEDRFSNLSAYPHTRDMMRSMFGPICGDTKVRAGDHPKNPFEAVEQAQRAATDIINQSPSKLSLLLAEYRELNMKQMKGGKLTPVEAIRWKKLPYLIAEAQKPAVLRKSGKKNNSRKKQKNT